MKILLVDNYDSFTYNLLHYLEEVAEKEVIVVRNDQLKNFSAEDVTHIVISPGPGLPAESGDLLAFIRSNLHKRILGVCLGQQAIAEVAGQKLKQLDEVVHGQARTVHILDPEEKLFVGLPTTFKVGRYHSWLVDKAELPSNLKVTAVDDAGEIMGLRHMERNISAVQFHPESILTEYGREMIRNWLKGE